MNLEGINRDHLTAKIFGVVCGIAALAELVLVFFGGGLATVLMAAANAILAVCCFREFEQEKMMLTGSLGLMIVYDLLGLFTGGKISASSVSNILIGAVAHAIILAYIFGNFFTRNRAMLAGAVAVIDKIWRVWMASMMLKSLAGLIGSIGGDAALTDTYVKLAVFAAFLNIVPTIAYTVMLFTGTLDYGN